MILLVLSRTYLVLSHIYHAKLLFHFYDMERTCGIQI